MQWSQWIKQESRVTFNGCKAQRPQTQPEMSACKTWLYASDVKKKKKSMHRQNKDLQLKRNQMHVPVKMQ